MKNDALTLRLPTSLARALAGLAKARGIAKSQLVREAVSRYIDPAAPNEQSPVVTARLLAARWAGIPRLTPEEATDFGSDIESARAALPALRTPWE